MLLAAVLKGRGAHSKIKGHAVENNRLPAVCATATERV